MENTKFNYSFEGMLLRAKVCVKNCTEDFRTSDTIRNYAFILIGFTIYYIKSTDDADFYK